MTAETQLNPQCSVAAEVTLPEKQGNEVIETRERGVRNKGKISNVFPNNSNPNGHYHS